MSPSSGYKILLFVYNSLKVLRRIFGPKRDEVTGGVEKTT
jgi:hypothetical protein